MIGGVILVGGAINVDTLCRIDDTFCMQGVTTTKKVASRLGVSQRQVQRLSTARIGGSYVITDRQMIALSRARFTGRRWSTRTVEAALDLLAGKRAAELTASERSRLRRRLREADLGAVCAQILQDRVQLRTATKAASSASLSIGEELGLSGEGGVDVLVTENPVSESRKRRLALDANGNVIVITGRQEHRKLLEAMALFTYGDSRANDAARAWLDQCRRGETS